MSYDLPSTNITELDQFLVWQSGQIPILWPSILFLIFMVIFGAGYGFQSKRERGGSLAMWFSIAGVITTVIAFVLFLINGLIPLEVLGICVLVSIVGALWFLFSSDN